MTGTTQVRMTQPAAEKLDLQPKNTSMDAALWVLSDGTAGMRLQAIGLAEALARHRPELAINEFQVIPHWLIRLLPRLGHRASFLPLYASAVDLSVVQKRPDRGRHADLLITCGRRMAGIGLALRARARAEGARTQLIHLQDPQLSPALFDVLVVPKHDRVRGRNVITMTGSLNRLTLESIQRSMMDLPSKWLVRDKVPCVVVMLGGDNKRYRISPKMTTTMAARLRAFAESEPMRLVLIPSRRTPALLVETLEASLGQKDVRIVGPNETNPYPGILGVADAIIVTSDSVNMVTESAITGKPVLIAGWNVPASEIVGGVTGEAAKSVGERGRIAAFHRRMIDAGHTTPLANSLPRKRFTALDEIDEVCGHIFRILDR